RPGRTAARRPSAPTPTPPACRAPAPSRHAPGSRVDPPCLQCARDLVDPGDERGLPKRDPPRPGELPHPVERVAELVREACTDFVTSPEQAAEILHPLEVRHRH